MRTVTLGSLGAVAPIVPAGAPQLYGTRGIGVLDAMTDMDPKKTLGIGLTIGIVLGAAGMHFYMKR